MPISLVRIVHSVTESTFIPGQRLAGARIALLFMTDLTYSTRLNRAVEALRAEGAHVALVSTTANTGSLHWFDEVHQVGSFEFGPVLETSRIPWQPARTAVNVTKNWVRPFFTGSIRHGQTVLRTTLCREFADYNIYWAIDVMALPSAVSAAETTGAAVIYETLDLVQEYCTAPTRISSARRAAEREFIGRVSAFVTAGESYADYYEQL